jgi:hypothetical protein
MASREIPTLSLIQDGEKFRIEATSYGRTQPSGLGEFTTLIEAEMAMNRLQRHLDEQRGKKEVSKKKLRQIGAD